MRASMMGGRCEKKTLKGLKFGGGGFEAETLTQVEIRTGIESCLTL